MQKLKIDPSNPLRGKFAWHNGIVVFCVIERVDPARLIGVGTMLEMLSFINYLNSKGVPQSTNHLKTAQWLKR